MADRLMPSGLILLRARHCRVEHLDLVYLLMLLVSLLWRFNRTHDLLGLLAQMISEGVELEELSAAAFGPWPTTQALHLRVVVEGMLLLVWALDNRATA